MARNSIVVKSSASHRLEWTRHIARCSGLSMRAKAAAHALGVSMSPGGLSPSKVDRPAPSLKTIGEWMGSVSASTAQRGIFELEGRDPRSGGKVGDPSGIVGLVWLSVSGRSGGRGVTPAYRALIPIHVCTRLGGNTWSPTTANPVNSPAKTSPGWGHSSPSSFAIAQSFPWEQLGLTEDDWRRQGCPNPPEEAAS